MRPSIGMVVLVAASLLAGCGRSPSQRPGPAGSGLQVNDVVPGNGAVAENGRTLTVHYTGWLLDGTKFDSSHDRGDPFTFTLGAGQVIRGWDLGMAGMRVGGTRELIIPPGLAYGERGAGGAIPPNATLRFRVELLDAK
ncbi:MAG: FKBP-type peptidyl-prolyl cis-trans isomerase [Candidatus Eisenbacteria bacterium]|nr:FKBP-type peptidyl-prolyl cis-trans isomerase [Candidatus Eisenbacteria bacterium]